MADMDSITSLEVKKARILYMCCIGCAYAVFSIGKEEKTFVPIGLVPRLDRFRFVCTVPMD